MLLTITPSSSIMFFFLIGCVHFSVADVDGNTGKQQCSGQMCETWTPFHKYYTDDITQCIESNSIVPDKINVIRPYFEDYWEDDPNEVLDSYLVAFTNNGWVLKFIDLPFEESYISCSDDEYFYGSHCLLRNQDLENLSKYHIITPNGDDVTSPKFIGRSMYDTVINNYPGQMITKRNSKCPDEEDDLSRCNETMTRKLLMIYDVPEWYRKQYTEEQEQQKLKQMQTKKKKSRNLGDLCDEGHDKLQRRSNFFMHYFLATHLYSTSTSTLLLLNNIPPGLTLDHIEESVGYTNCYGRDVRLIRSLSIQGGFAGLLTGGGVSCYVMRIENAVLKENDLPDDLYLLSREKWHNPMLDKIHGPDNEGYYLINGIQYNYGYQRGESYLEGGLCRRQNVSVIIFRF